MQCSQWLPQATPAAGAAPSAPPYGICRFFTFCQAFMFHIFLVGKILTGRFFFVLSVHPGPSVLSESQSLWCCNTALSNWDDCSSTGPWEKGEGAGLSLSSTSADEVPLSKAGRGDRFCFNQQWKQEVQFEVKAALFVTD